MRTSGGVNLLELFFAFLVNFQLFSELAVNQATRGAATLFAFQKEMVKRERLYALYHVCFVSVEFNSFALK